ncbi:3-isopropylmalate dehydratase small subunit [Rhodobacterales bacterium]|nr:3-isopropylmalate dehydratase small subunit [Rhodobacterales bacterium]
MMPFEKISSRAVWLPEDNIDTDVIYPARFLLIMDREGLGRYLFHDRRFDAHGNPIPGFPLDAPGAEGAKVLVAGDGFGCGSSREQAVWTLLGHGFRVIIAPGFGDIFAANCLKNGLLPLTVSRELATELGEAAAAGSVFEADLETMQVTVDGREVIRIDLGEKQRQAMLNGWDETDILLREDGDHIDAFEAGHRQRQPWLFHTET